MRHGGTQADQVVWNWFFGTSYVDSGPISSLPTNVDLVRIEWPSGIVTQFTNVWGRREIVLSLGAGSGKLAARPDDQT